MSAATRRKKIAKIQRKTATSVIYHLGKSAGSMVEARRYDQAYELNSKKEALSLNNRIANAGNLYRAHQERAATGHSLLSLNQEIITGAMAIGVVTAGPLGVGAVLTTSGVAIAMDTLMDWTIDMFDETAQKSADNALRLHLKRLSEDQTTNLIRLEDDYRAALTLNDPAQREAAKKVVQKIIFKPGSGIFNGDVPDVPEEARPAVQYYMGKMLEEKLETAITLQQIANEVQDQEINSLKTNMKQLTSTSLVLSRMVRTNKSSLLALRDSVEGIQISLTDIKENFGNRIGDLEGDVEFLNQYMFSQMDPSQQLDYLENQNLTGMTEEEKDKLKIKVQAVKRKQDFIKASGDVLNTASQVAGIINDLSDELDLDPKFVNTINEGVRIGTAVFNAFASFATGNYVGAVSAIVGGLFGGGGSDPAAQRHEQIMSRLNAIYDNQIHMMQELHEIKQSLGEIMNNQKTILDTIVNVYQTIESNHRSMLKEILVTQRMIGSLTALNISMAWRDIDKLGSFIDQFDAAGHQSWSYKNGSFDTYDDLVQHFRHNNAHYSSGWHDAETVISSHDINAIFLMETYAAQTSKLNEQWLNPSFLASFNSESEDSPELVSDISGQIKAVFWGIILRKAAMNLWLERYASGNDHLFEKGLVQGLNPTDKIGAVINRWGLANDQTEAGFLVQLDVSWFKDNLSSIVDPDAVIKVASWILQTHHYEDLIFREENRAYTEEELLNGRLANGKTIEFTRAASQTLFYAKRIVELALLQQSVTSGEGVLPVISYYIATPGADADKKRQALNLITYNLLLRRNWINQVIYDGLKVNGWTVDSYEYALRNNWKTPENLKRLVFSSLVPADVSGQDVSSSTKEIGWKLEWTYKGDCIAIQADGSELRQPYSELPLHQKLICKLPESVLNKINEYWELSIDTDGNPETRIDSISLKLPVPSSLISTPRSVKFSAKIENLYVIRNQLDMAIAEYGLAVEMSEADEEKGLNLAEDLVACVMYNNAICPQ